MGVFQQPVEERKMARRIEETMRIDGTECLVALKFGDGSIEWNGVRYADDDALYEAADSLYGENPALPLVILEKCGGGEKITH
jgi:hypothetical protein